eukprot:SAG31_NODE_20266_length_579_cov_0.987500_1_plen_182_part_00
MARMPAYIDPHILKYALMVQCPAAAPRPPRTRCAQCHCCCSAAPRRRPALDIIAMVSVLDGAQLLQHTPRLPTNHPRGIRVGARAGKYNGAVSKPCAARPATAGVPLESRQSRRHRLRRLHPMARAAVVLPLRLRPLSRAKLFSSRRALLSGQCPSVAPSRLGRPYPRSTAARMHAHKCRS